MWQRMVLITRHIPHSAVWCKFIVIPLHLGFSKINVAFDTTCEISVVLRGTQNSTSKEQKRKAEKRLHG